MTVFYSAFSCALVTLTTILTLNAVFEHSGALPVRIGPLECQCRPAHLWVTARGLWLDGRPVTPSELPARLGSTRAVAFEADDGVRYDDVVHAIDAIRGAGVTEIGVLP